jgi:hypothetical protein
LGGERLYFLCDDSKTSAGFARARRLDRCVQCQQISLFCNGRNQLNNVADARGSLRNRASAGRSVPVS